MLYNFNYNKLLYYVNVILLVLNWNIIVFNQNEHKEKKFQDFFLYLNLKTKSLQYISWKDFRRYHQKVLNQSSTRLLITL